MGGKTWSRDEEEFFWHVIIPQSPKAVKVEDRINDWEECAKIMVRAMGKEARRKYTRLMLFEHYFQNVQTGHFSPHAVAFVTEHKQQLANEEKHFQIEASASVAAEDTNNSLSPRLSPIAVPRARLARNPQARSCKSLTRLLIPASYSPASGVFPTSATSSSSESSPSSWTRSDRITKANPACYGADWTQGGVSSPFTRSPWSTVSPLTSTFCYFPRDQRCALNRPDIVPHSLPPPYTGSAPASVLGKRPLDQLSSQVNYSEAMRLATYDVRYQSQLPMNSLVMAASLDHHSNPIAGPHGYPSLSTPMTSPIEVYSHSNNVDDGTASQNSSTVGDCGEKEDDVGLQRN